jgi:hypothetical protein
VGVRGGNTCPFEAHTHTRQNAETATQARRLMEIVSAKVTHQSTTAGISQDMLTRALSAKSLEERREVCAGVYVLVCVCVSVCLSVCLSICLSVCLSVCLSACSTGMRLRQLVAFNSLAEVLQPHTYSDRPRTTLWCWRRRAPARTSCLAWVRACGVSVQQSAKRDGFGLHVCGRPVLAAPWERDLADRPDIMKRISALLEDADEAVVVSALHCLAAIGTASPHRVSFALLYCLLFVLFFSRACASPSPPTNGLTMHRL